LPVEYAPVCSSNRRRFIKLIVLTDAQALDVPLPRVNDIVWEKRAASPERRV